MFELRKQFSFEAAHTLVREIEAEPSRRIHGHSYKAEIALRGAPDARTGMIEDLGALERMLQRVRTELDHQFLNDVPGLGPATLENLAAWIWRALQPELPSLLRVTVLREASGESCSYDGPGASR
jgi:6-pyruvoyltetrahydropterin/6-carboxytetrahydropterin synthase